MLPWTCLVPGFALDLRGRPRIVWSGGARSAAGWLTLRADALHDRAALHRVSRRDGEAAARRGAGRPRRARAVWRRDPLRAGGWACACGSVSSWSSGRRGGSCDASSCIALQVARRGHATVLELTVANLGNVTESLRAARAVLSKAKDGRVVAGVSAANRDLRPRTRGIVAFRYRRTLHGWMTARVVIPADGGRRRLQRTYRIRL